MATVAGTKAAAPAYNVWAMKAAMNANGASSVAPTAMVRAHATTAVMYPSGTRKRRRRKAAMRARLLRCDHRFQRHPFADAQALALALQLAAGGEDVAAARGADGRGVAGAVDDVGKALDGVPVRALVARPRPGIERDQVDLGRDAGEQADQRLRVGARIVDVLEHDVLE